MTVPKLWAVVQRNKKKGLLSYNTFDRKALSAVGTQNVFCKRFYALTRCCGPTRYACETVKHSFFLNR